ncbi:MAG: YdeI/OmpD-associated family protein [Saprospiraceae bacterium]
MEFKGKIDNFQNSNVYGHHLIVPEEVVEFFSKKNIKRFTCTLNNEYQFPCAFMPKGKGIYFIHINAEVRKIYRLRVGSKVSVKLEPDESKYGMPMPEEMDELLKIDDEARQYFHALTKGKQRSLLYIIGKPKSSEIRINKAIVITEHLKRMNGKLDFKILNQDFKAFNQR